MSLGSLSRRYNATLRSGVFSAIYNDLPDDKEFSYRPDNYFPNNQTIGYRHQRTD
ncbi:hypothetical protein AAKU64_002806 [Undibacterium sp. GrIS 1.8]|uniref:hypothetical protein n=1 Tax=Undibacterium sp. GrIS 1.8 TaxID=3143934 RepID=UPI0033979A07